MSPDPSVRVCVRTRDGGVLQVGKPVAERGVCPAGEPGRGCLARRGWACSPLGVFREAEGAPSEVTASPVLPGPSLALVLHLGPPGRGEGPQAHRQGRCGVLSSRRSPGQSPPGEGCVGLSRNPAGTPRPALSGVPAVTCHMGLGGPLTEPAALYSQLEGWGAGDRGLYRHRWCGDGSEVPRRTAA